ncbi:hypothetical protein [Paenibacillus validus]|uniref:Uncharacterized protein n=1 Tax=Paenibacillus validus TaxID=44253 RepID=A0A7X3CT67_9BACL|nr:hypothetical protein [Paenibacillus validus]MUG70767.1 hypothetical protein [Paenibacillus validus]
MPGTTNKRRTPGKKMRVLSITLAGLLLLFALPWHTAHAGIVERIKDIYGMPEQVGQLQEQYEETKRQLEQSREQMEETVARSEEAARQFREAEARLLEENRELRSRNDRLEQLLEQMEAARRAQSVRNRQIAATALTAAGLALLYFIITRVIRFTLWRRGRGGAQGGSE